MQWPGKKPSQFLYFHGYILIVYVIAFLVNLASPDSVGLIYTVGALAPLMVAIFNGLPVDCFDYEAAILREYDSKS